MDFRQAIQPFSGQPIYHWLLMSLLKGYKRPNDKIHELLQSGTLEAVKKGLYVVGNKLGLQQPEPFLLSNHLYGPSYVSMDAALSHYGLIPERVYEISGVTAKISRQFITKQGVFNYIHLPMPYYSFGIQQVKIADRQFAMMACAEKALMDKVVTTSGLVLRSRKGAFEYLIENLRMEEGQLKEMNLSIMKEWSRNAPKKESLLFVIDMIGNL
ncbi:Transcriptional regulator, AbiEi antitoxin, Type IV TA system [bacterium A37T11]|nr:Transcriptional regulator, AbiEi antitoxin, Type IV TA system [bacterium A37T11]